MKLTMDMRKAVEEKETRRLFHDKVNAAKNAAIKAIEDELSKTAKVFPEELITEGWIATSDSVYLSGARLDEDTNHRSSGYSQHVQINKRFPRRVHQGNFNVQTTKEINEAWDAYLQLKEERRQFKRKITQVLNAFTTVKKLVAHVPELEIYFKDELTAKTMAVVPMDKINELRKTLQAQKEEA